MPKFTHYFEFLKPSKLNPATKVYAIWPPKLHQEMPKSSPPPPSPLIPTQSPSKKRLLANQKPKQTTPRQNLSPIHLPHKDKKTRNLPNLSDCHGCGLRIDYSNPRKRLRLLDSFWRIVLLCKKCIKRVNSGQICLYCFKDTDNSASGCFKCPECDRLIHNNCVKKFGNSTPWSYCSRDLGFSVCIDCWVPELLKKPVRVCNKKKQKNANGDSGSFRKAQNGDRSLEEIIKDASCAVEKKVAVAVKAKEKAFSKAVVAQNAVELASSALDLAVKKDHSGKTISEGLVRNSSNKDNGLSNVTKVVDDVALAFRLHRAMNSSPRISRNTCLLNSSCLDVLKKTGSNDILPKWIDSGTHEGGNLGVYTNSNLDENQDRSISQASAHVESKESGFAIVSDRLQPVLRTYLRNNLKRKKCLDNVEDGGVVTNVDVVKPVLRTYARNNLKRKQCLENGEVGDVVTNVDVVKPVLKTYLRHNLKREECLEKGEVGDVVTSVGAKCLENREVGDVVTNVDVVKPVMKTYARNNLKRKECLENGEVGDVISSVGAKSILKTYMRNNLKRKECLENGEVCDVVTSVGIAGTFIIKDDSITVSESQLSLQDEPKMELLVEKGWASSSELSNAGIIQQEGCAIARPQQNLLEYSKGATDSSRGIQNDASSSSLAFQKENQASAPKFAYCSTDSSGLFDASLHSSVVNLQGCASAVGSSQVG